VRELRNAVERAIVLGDREQIIAADLPPQVLAAAPPRTRTASPTPPLGSGSIALPSITIDPLPPPVPAAPVAAAPAKAPPPRSLRDLEKQGILAALAATGGNKAQAAAILEIDRSTLYKKLKDYDIEANARRLRDYSIRSESFGVVTSEGTTRGSRRNCETLIPARFHAGHCRTSIAQRSADSQNSRLSDVDMFRTIFFMPNPPARWSEPRARAQARNIRRRDSGRRFSCWATTSLHLTTSCAFIKAISDSRAPHRALGTIYSLMLGNLAIPRTHHRCFALLWRVMLS
jgi:hypothetical protein